MFEGKRIEKIRKSFRLSRSEFGKKLGISSDQVGKIERGEREASRAVLIKIVETFPTISFEYILTGKRGPHNKGNGGMNPFLDLAESVESALAKEMFDSMNQLASGIQTFDKISTGSKS